MEKVKVEGRETAGGFESAWLNCQSSSQTFHSRFKSFKLHSVRSNMNSNYLFTGPYCQNQTNSRSVLRQQCWGERWGGGELAPCWSRGAPTSTTKWPPPVFRAPEESWSVRIWWFCQHLLSFIVPAEIRVLTTVLITVKMKPWHTDDCSKIMHPVCKMWLCYSL